MIALEEIAAGTTGGEKLAATAMALVWPRNMLLRRLAGGRTVTLDDTATIIFSSGSTGEPKGAMLSHYNIVSNMMQLNQVFDFKRDDRFLGVLPILSFTWVHRDLDRTLNPGRWRRLSPSADRHTLYFQADSPLQVNPASSHADIPAALPAGLQA